MITFDAASTSGYIVLKNSSVYTHSVGTGDNRFLTVAVSLLGSSVNSVTANSNSMFLIRTGGTSSRAELWGMVSPDSGSNQIKVVFSTTVDSISSTLSFFGVNQESPTESPASDFNISAGSDVLLVVVPTVDGTWVIDSITALDESIAAGSGQVVYSNTSGTFSGANSSEGPISPASSVVMSWSGIGDAVPYGFAAYALKPSDSSNPQLFSYMFTGA